MFIIVAKKKRTKYTVQLEIFEGLMFLCTSVKTIGRRSLICKIMLNSSKNFPLYGSYDASEVTSVPLNCKY